MGERIAVVGATGYTGRLVVEELGRRDVEAVAVGRDTALPDALDGCRAVVSCVGSFIDAGEAVVRAALDAGVPYVDTSAEFPFLRRIYEAYDVPARAAGVPIVPGMAFYSAPADFAAALAVEALRRPVDEVVVFYRLAGARPSRGTVRTNLRRIGQPCPVRQGGRLVDRRIGDDAHLVRFPDPDGDRCVARWPGGEVLTVPRHTGAPSVGVFLSMPNLLASLLRQPRITGLLQPLGRLLVGRGTGGPSAEARHRATFLIVVEARAGTASAARCVVEGHDLYGLSAAACAEAAQRLTAPPEPLSGALAPAQAFQAADFLDTLSDHLTWRIET